MPIQFAAQSDSVGTPQTVTTSYKTQMSGVAQTATLRRGRVIELKMGPLSDPSSTDCNILYAIQRQTAAGTGGSTVTPNFAETWEAGTAPSAGSLWGANYTAEGTYGTRIWSMFMNQHSGMIWYSPDDIGLPWPAVNNNGLAFMTKGSSASYSGTSGWDVKFTE